MLLQRLLSGQQVWALKLAQLPTRILPASALISNIENKHVKIICRVKNIGILKVLPQVYKMVKTLTMWQQIAMYRFLHTLLTRVEIAQGSWEMKIVCNRHQMTTVLDLLMLLQVHWTVLVQHISMLTTQAMALGV